ncbi:MAG: SMC-Scp complex subunit ScpB, partial [Candidatus Puniceispirillaceae bacterium]
LKAAGLLRKGQILGALMDHAPQTAESDHDEHDDELDGELDGDFLEDGLLEAGYDGEQNA